MDTLLDTQLPHERIAKFERFLVDWVGPRSPNFGEPEGNLKDSRLPEFLREFYRFAGRWPAQDESGRLLFATQDCLVPLESLTYEDDRPVFLCENQGVWQFASEIEGPDPALWVKETDLWRKSSLQLSCTLVSFGLQELLFGAKLCVSDQQIEAHLRPSLDHAIPLWKGPSLWSAIAPKDDPDQFGSTTFWLADHRILVQQQGDTWFFAANDTQGVAWIESHEAPITAIGLCGRGERVHINPDGGGEITLVLWTYPFRTARAEIPRGTLDYKNVLNTLLPDIVPRQHSNQINVQFHREKGSCRVQGLKSDANAKRYMDIALANATTDEKFIGMLNAIHRRAPDSRS